MERGYNDMQYKLVVAAQYPLPLFSLIIRTPIFFLTSLPSSPCPPKPNVAVRFGQENVRGSALCNSSEVSLKNAHSFLPRPWLRGLGALAPIWDSEVMGHILGVAKVLAGQILCLEDLGEQDHACLHCLPLGSFSILCKPLPTWAFCTL